MKRILLVGASVKHMNDMKRIVYNVYAEKRIDSAYSAEQARGILQNNSFYIKKIFKGDLKHGRDKKFIRCN